MLIENCIAMLVGIQKMKGSEKQEKLKEYKEQIKKLRRTFGRKRRV